MQHSQNYLVLLGGTKMDIKWCIDEQMGMVANGGCKLAATNGILNAMLMAESDTIVQYEYGKQALIKLFEGETDKQRILAKMVDNIINDEKNHIESFNKASAIITGAKEPKADEYNSAVKSND